MLSHTSYILRFQTIAGFLEAVIFYPNTSLGHQETSPARWAKTRQPAARSAPHLALDSSTCLRMASLMTHCQFSMPEEIKPISSKAIARKWNTKQKFVKADTAKEAAGNAKGADKAIWHLTNDLITTTGRHISWENVRCRHGNAASNLGNKNCIFHDTSTWYVRSGPSQCRLLALTLSRSLSRSFALSFALIHSCLLPRSRAARGVTANRNRDEMKINRSILAFRSLCYLPDLQKTWDAVFLLSSVCSLQGIGICHKRIVMTTMTQYFVHNVVACNNSPRSSVSHDEVGPLE